MGRIRSIKPELPKSESMGRCTREARLCFILLWTESDDSGRLRGDSRLLASLLYPYDDDAKDLMPGWLDQLEQEGCIIRYHVDGNSYIQIRKWHDHQKIDKPSASKIPPFVEHSSNPREPSPTDLDMDQDLDKDKDQGNDARTQLSWNRPPTKLEVINEFTNLGIEDATNQAELFWSNYQSKSWMLGNTKITDWKARIPIWINQGAPKGRASPTAAVVQTESLEDAAKRRHLQAMQ